MNLAPDHLRPHAGKLLGLLLGLPLGVWGVVFGVLAGMAIDKWRSYTAKLEAPVFAPSAPPAGGVTTAILLLGYARSERFWQVRDAVATLAILKHSFVLDSAALRALGKLMQQDDDGAAAGWALPQLRQLISAPLERRAAWLGCLTALASDASGGVPPGSRTPLTEAAAALALPVPVFTDSVSDDPWRILNLARNASQAEIVQAYHAQMRAMHPDRNVGGSAADMAWRTTQAARINAAYEALKQGRAAL